MRPRVLIMGAGFAGFHCARQLERKLEAHEAEVALGLTTVRGRLAVTPEEETKAALTATGET